MQFKLEFALNNQVALHESLSNMMSSVLERLNVMPGPTKAEIDEIEKGRIREILFKGDISFQYDQVVQMIVVAKERQLFGLNLLTIFFSQEKLGSASYEKDQKTR